MAANYILLETITVGEAGASSVTFNNIPQSGYTDLLIKWSARDSSTNDYVALSVNGNSSAFTQKTLFGTGSAASSFTTPVQYVGHLDNTNLTANTFTNSEIYIPNYTSSNNKSYSADGAQENNGSGAQVNITAGVWSNTAPITSITLSPSGANFVQYSTFSLYGLAAVGTTPVIAPYASGGDIIQTDGTYWYHAFLSSGTFTPAKALSCDYLVVAGGGGGSSDTGGGGGAGGFRTSIGGSPLAITANSATTVTIGAGGSGAGSNGSNSVFATITSTGGGAGAGYSNAGTSGGSGGGGAAFNNGPSSGTSGQGNSGGTGASNGAGGGGGAGGVGSNSDGTNGGTGGAGTYNSLTDAAGALLGVGQLSSGHYYFAGGGGGSTRNNSAGNRGAAGVGGGGIGGYYTTAAGSGTPNTGGGAGGNDFGSAPKGGSGIVIVRYAI